MALPTTHSRKFNEKPRSQPSRGGNAERLGMLQQHLRALNYNQRLTADCVPLVESIFSDLVDVTRKYQSVRNERAKAGSEAQARGAQIQPLRKDNERLRKDNNDMRLKMMKQGEQHDNNMRELRARVSQGQSQLEESQFLLKQRSHRIKTVELELSQVKKRLDTVLAREAVYTDDMRTSPSGDSLGAGGEPRKIQGRPQHMTGEEVPRTFVNPLSPSDCQGAAGLSREDVDVLKVAQERLEQLKQELQCSRATEARLLSQVGELTTRVESRETEVKRLGAMVDSEDSWQQLRGKLAGQANDDAMEQLRRQVEFLNTELGRAEEDLKSFTDQRAEVARLQEANEELEGRAELGEAEAGALRAEIKKLEGGELIKKGTTEAALRIRELHEVKRKLRAKENRLLVVQAEAKKQKRGLEDTAEERDGLRRERTKLKEVLQGRDRDLTTLRAGNEELEKDVTRLSDELAKARQDALELECRKETLEGDLGVRKETQQDLETKCTEMRTMLERAQQECQIAQARAEETGRQVEMYKGQLGRSREETRTLSERLTEMVAAKGAVERSRTALEDKQHQLGSSKKQLEAEAAHLREEAASLRALLANEKTKALESGRASEASTKRADETQHRLSVLQAEHEALCQELKGAAQRARKLQGELDERARECGRLENQLRDLRELQGESLEAQKQSGALEIELRRAKRELERVQAGLAAQEAERGGDAAKIAQLEKERDYLSTLIQRFHEQQVAIQTKVRTICADRDHLQQLYDQAQSDLKSRADKDGVLSRDQDACQQAIRDLRERNETLEREVEHLKEINAQRNAAVEEAMAKTSSMERAHEAVTRELKMERERAGQAGEDHDGLHRRFKELQEQKHALQLQIEKLTQDGNRERQNCVDQQRQITELKALCHQMDQTRDATDRRLREIMGEYEGKAQRIEQLQEAQRAGLERVEAAGRDNEGLKVILQDLSAERDRLQEQLDQRDEALAQHAHSQRAMVGESDRAGAIIAEQDQRIREREGALAHKDNDIHALHAQVEEVVGRCQALEEEGRLKSEQLRTAGADIHKIMDENQRLNNSLAATVMERDNRSQDLERALAKLMFVEEQIKLLDKEKTDVAARLDAVESDHQRVSCTAEALDKERTQYRVEMAALRDQVARRDIRLAEQDKQITGHLNDRQAMARGNQEMKREIQQLCNRLDLREAESKALSRDLQSSRGVSHTFEQSTQDTQRQLMMLKQQNEALNKQLGTLDVERQVLKEKLGYEQKQKGDLQRVMEDVRMGKGRERDNHERTRNELHDLRKELQETLNRNERLETQLKAYQRIHET